MPKLWNLWPPPPPELPSLPEQIYFPLLSSFEVLATLKLLTMNMIKTVVGTKQITEVIKIFPSLIEICLITSLWRWWGQKKQWDPIIASPPPLSSPNEKLQKCKSAPKQPLSTFFGGETETGLYSLSSVWAGSYSLTKSILKVAEPERIMNFQHELFYINTKASMYIVHGLSFDVIIRSKTWDVLVNCDQTCQTM